MSLKKAFLVVCISLLPFSFVWAMEIIKQPEKEQKGETALFKLGFEFQESNHLLNQGNEKYSVSLSDEYIKKPLVEFRYLNEKIFHIEADDLDLEIVTVPFPSDAKERMKRSFEMIQIFVNQLYTFIEKNPKVNNLFEVLEKINPELNKAGLQTNLEERSEWLKKIKIFKKEDFVPGFKPQFSVQTNLSNFLLYYFYLFASSKENKRLSVPMIALSRTIAKENLENEGAIDLTNNFVSLYLYTCISPQVSTEFTMGFGMGIFESMINAMQCDYRIYLPIMSRISFSELSQCLKNDWRTVMQSRWAEKIYNNANNVGFYNFGDFYDAEITKELISYLDVNVIKLSDQDIYGTTNPSFYSNALKQGIITTEILRKLKGSAFVNLNAQQNMNSYINNYGKVVYQSIGQGKNKQLTLQFNKVGQDLKISFDEIETKKDLFSPPFLSQKGSAMGAVDLQNLDLKYGNFLFEVRRVNALGQYINSIIKLYDTNVMPRDFLQVPTKISRDASILIDILDIECYKLPSEYSFETLKTFLLKEMWGWFK